MDDLFGLTMPWWEFLLRGAVCYLGLLFLLRLTGKRSFGELSPFDIVVLILVGGALRSAMVGKDASLIGPFLCVIGVLAMDKLLGFLAARSQAFNHFIEGRHVLLARKGALVPDALRRQNISQSAFERELRSHEVRSVSEVDEAILESNGRITVFKNEKK